ncbi:hypothetical protein GCM10027271_22670 [Saccharopolyspora gloriosae]|uniref:Uncharacterized protein n=1 Tax=Saccharopolyspora gloriosae TaxID=455344 RepID=A0A840NRT7_9PSEU|nr:hypothetical protein [Saccharopolyspora gloriosae]MBB5070937.1 hypothetical protein [Saccharopolyspora gloriosae]
MSAPTDHSAAPPAWITSEWCSTWHLSGRTTRGAVIVASCGHPLSGRMSRVFDRPPPLDTRQVCQACVAATSTRPGSVRFPVLEDALVVMAERRSSRATTPPEPDPPITWPDTDPDAPGVRAQFRPLRIVPRVERISTARAA